VWRLQACNCRAGARLALSVHFLELAVQVRRRLSCRLINYLLDNHRISRRRVSNIRSSSSSSSSSNSYADLIGVGRVQQSVLEETKIFQHALEMHLAAYILEYVALLLGEI
jgi:hypothetical protein